MFNVEKLNTQKTTAYKTMAELKPNSTFSDTWALSCIIANVNADDCTTEETANTARDIYLKIMKQPDTKVVKQDILKVALDVIRIVEREGDNVETKKTLSEFPTLLSSSDGKTITIDRPIILGRGVTMSDVSFGTLDTISRIHCILIPSFKLQRIYVVDTGSLNGTATDIVKDNDGNMETRRIHNANSFQSIYFDISSSFRIRCLNGDHRSCVVINPKKCIICVDKSRTKSYDCGHFVACEGCFSKIDVCPICRKAGKKRLGYDARLLTNELFSISGSTKRRRI